MSDEKSSDLDVFEGLTKKKKSLAPIAAEPSIESDVASVAAASDAPRSLPPANLPPAKKTMLGMAAPLSEADATPPASLPKPSLPAPSRRPVSSPPSPILTFESEINPELTTELRRPSKEDLQRLMMGDEPAAAPSSTLPSSTLGAQPYPLSPTAPPALGAFLQIVPDSDSDSEEAAQSVPAELVSAAALEEEGEGLAWDDEEESTSVFGRSHAEELFGNLAGEHMKRIDEGGRRPDFSAMSALLANSNRPAPMAPGGASASSVDASSPAVSVMPSIPFDGLPKIPGPAPIPREIGNAVSFDSAPAPPSSSTLGRAPTPTWSPSVPAPGAALVASSPSRTNVWLGLVAALVVALAAFLWLRGSGPGTLVVRVVHQGKPVDTAQVFVDGQQVCTFTPCRVKNVDQGKREIRVASGALVGQGSVEVKGGSSESELEIQLTLGGASPDSAPVASGHAVGGAPPAALALKTSLTEKVKVFVDGQEKGTLPLELKDLKPGSLTLRFEAAGDKYGKLEKTVELEAGKTFSIDDVKLPFKLVLVTFKLATAGAAVKLKQEGKPDTVLAFGGEKVEKKLDTTVKWTLTASLKDYSDFEQVIVFEDGKGTATVEIKLDKNDAATAAVPVAPTVAGASAPPPTVGPAAADFGTINANSLPPSSVLIDGRPHGQTPVTGVRVAAGSHTVVFKHKDFGIQSRGVSVAAGKAATVTVKFDVKGGDEKPKKKKKPAADE